MELGRARASTSVPRELPRRLSLNRPSNQSSPAEERCPRFGSRRVVAVGTAVR